MSLQHYLQGKSESTSSGLRFSMRSIVVEDKLISAFSILLISTLMFFNIFFENINELTHLLNDEALSESLLVNIVSFFGSSLMPSQLLIGLCWLVFLFFPARRAGIVLRKTVFAFCEILQSFIFFSPHGSRAPPQIKG
ncbi:hypothetical protein ACM9HF_10990 [Colwellia sp. RE-S-Sl-9]